MRPEERCESPSMGMRPARHRLTTLFVDIASSTSLLVQHAPEAQDVFAVLAFALHYYKCSTKQAWPLARAWYDAELENGNL